MPTNETTTGAPDLPMGWRFKVGIALFADDLVLAFDPDLSSPRPRLVSSIGEAV
jgi:hypothetical protein